MSDLQNPWHRIVLLRKKVENFKEPVLKKGILGGKKKKILALKEKSMKD